MLVAANTRNDALKWSIFGAKDALDREEMRCGVGIEVCKGSDE